MKWSRQCRILACMGAMVLTGLPFMAWAQETLAPPQAKALKAVASNHERLAYHADSLIGLAAVIVALLAAWAMNHRNASTRTNGIWLSALTSLGVAAAIFMINQSGTFANAKPPIFPTDTLKPSVMLVLGGLFAVGGLALSLVAVGQARQTQPLSLGLRNEPARYGRMSRYFHWTIAILFLMLMPMGVFTSMIPEGVAYRQAFYVIHKSIGFTVLILAAARLIWLIRSPAPKLSPDLKPWERFMAHSAHYTLYFFLFAFPITGFVMSTYGGKLSHFYFWDTPMLWDPSREAIKPWGLAHKLLLPYLFYLVLLGHVLGALKHQYIDKHKDSFRRMVG